MTNSENLYAIGETEKKLAEANYFFTSIGHKPLIKIVQYTFIGVHANRLTYNLGFGTFNIEERTVHDHDISANGDQYKVFNTVLSTIPDFFVNKHFSQLSRDYQFWGGRKLSDNQVITEDYVPRAPYDSVLFIRKQ